VPTTLLLEGDDLEALLERARAEGGPDARIVRAEKIRHGGLLGFFAKERFEVALEIPAPGDPRPAPAGAPGTPADTRTSDAPEERTMNRTHTPGGATQRLAERLAAAAADPRVAAAEGLLGLADSADRADAVELAALVPAVATAHPALALQGTGAGANASTSLAAASTAVEDALDLALRRLLEQQPAGASRTASSVRPSTARPEFTALLDQLRGGAEAPAPAPSPVAVIPAQRPAPVTAHETAAATTTGGAAPAASVVPAAYRAVAAPAPAPQPAFTAPAPAFTAPAPATPAEPPAAPTAAPTAAPVVERHVLGRTTRTGAGVQNRDRREDPQLAADRRALRDLGVPIAWTRQLRPGDRFGAVLRMLERMPEVDIDPATRVVAVVGPAASVSLEAHRTALDLPLTLDGIATPRPVVRIPAAAGADRAAALAEARLLGDVVVAVETDGAQQVPAAVEALQSIGAGAVIAVVAAADGVERAQGWLDALGQVDALAVEGTTGAVEPAAMLQLGLPVVRLDGIPVDHYTWTAVLCAHLGARVPLR
jgi:hypothetical protein